MTDDTDKAVLAVRAAFSNHFKAERNRAEQALSDILELCCSDQLSPCDQVDKVLARLEGHYSRLD
jgi:hypothetical protein